MKVKLALLFAVVITVSGCAEVAENSPGPEEPNQTGSEPAKPTFEPGKAFIYNTGGSDIVVFATGENSTHWKGIYAYPIPDSAEKAQYRRFYVNKNDLKSGSTNSLSRSELDSENLHYRTLTESMTYLYISTGGRSAEERRALTEPGNASIGMWDVEISKAEYRGWSAYAYNISTDPSSTVLYASREKPNIVLGTRGADDSPVFEIELVEIREEVNLSMTEELLNLSESSGASSDISNRGAEEAACPSTEGFDGEDVRIVDFGLSDEGLALEIRNVAAEHQTVESIEIESGRAEFKGSTQVRVGSSATFEVPGNFQEAGSCKALDVEISYNSEDMPGNQATGTINGEIALG